MVESRTGRRKTWTDRINRLALGQTEARLEVRFRLPFLWLAGLAAVSLLLPDRIWTTLLVGLIALIIVAFIWARSLARGLSAERRLQ